MTVGQLVTGLRHNRDFMKQVAAWERVPARFPQYVSLSLPLSLALRIALEKQGISQFYVHQVQAIEAALHGQNVVVATATASGKSLCYTVPVLQTLLEQPLANALYLFPTKALAQDQLSNLQTLLKMGNLPLFAHIYDGDTAQSQRQKVGQRGTVLITNPDMLHAGILPFHTRWRSFFSQLRYIVIDEIHTYRGVFGSHVANVLRRLQRLCQFYGSQPRFICCSATIANPQEHAERLTEQPFYLVDESQNGAPRGKKQIILYNPPMIDPWLGIRQSMTLAARDAALLFLENDVQTVLFGRSRQTVELLLSYLQDSWQASGRDEALLRAYRGGYLPSERRGIEQGLRTGQVMGVVATNALELGVDIGGLGAAILVGYPGSVAASWQQMGRAGRRNEADESVAILIAGMGAVDQYLCRHPAYLFGKSPEHALIAPDNLRILVSHLLCAAFELPFSIGDSFGNFGAVDELMQALAKEGSIYVTRRQYHYLGANLPAHTFSLRTSGQENVVIQDVSQPQPRVIGELDLAAASVMVHEGAVYLHQAQSYLVDALDWSGRVAHVRPVTVDYITKATSDSQIVRLQATEEQREGRILFGYGEVELISQVTGYRKMKRYTGEQVGVGMLDLPSMRLETMAFWLVIEEEMVEELVSAGILLAPNDYGPQWEKQRRAALERDEFHCRSCGTAIPPLHVHHVRPFREFVWEMGEIGEELSPALYERANQLGNLITLCPACHRRAEAGQQTRSALSGLAYALNSIAPLFLMCDVADLQVMAEMQNRLTKLPTVVLYERLPAGVGFSQKLFECRHKLLQATWELISSCPCQEGCPACVGAPGDIGPQAKVTTRQLIQKILEDYESTDFDKLS